MKGVRRALLASTALLGFATAAGALLGVESAGLAFSAADQSMVIRDPYNRANDYVGELSAKLGSIRTSAAMCYLSSGLLGWGPENQLTYSQEWDNGNWTKGATTISANAAVAPDGTLTADKLVEGSGGTFHTISQVGAGALTCELVFSVYLKAAERTWAYVQMDQGAAFSGDRFAYFNLGTGAVGTVQANTTAVMTAVGNGWYRCSVKATTIALASVTAKLITASNGSTISYSGDGVSGIYVWGAQLERAAAASAYKPTTSAAYYGLRLDYDPRLTGGPGYLVEEARTNLLLRSQEFDNASWNKNNYGDWTTITVAADNIASPDGTTTAERITMPNSTVSGIFQKVNVVAGTTYTFSIYVKPGTFTPRTDLNFGISTWNVGVRVADDGPSVVRASATAWDAGEWQRVVVTYTVPGSGVDQLAPYVGVNGPNSNGETFYLWGAQLEAGSFASSYIPTTTATVTRAADVPILLGTAFPLNTVEGALYAKFVCMGVTANSLAALCLNNNTASEFVNLGRGIDTPREGIWAIFDGGAPQVNQISTATIADLTATKSAGAYKLNDCAVAMAGEAVQTDTSCTMPTPTQLVFGNFTSGINRATNGWLSEGRYIPRRVANATLTAWVA